MGTDPWWYRGGVIAFAVLLRRAISRQAPRKEKSRRPNHVPQVIYLGHARVDRLAKYRIALLTVLDTGEEIWLDLNFAERQGFKDLKEGDVLDVSYGQSRFRRRRTDVINVHAIIKHAAVT